MKLEVKGLRKSFGETEVLHSISFTVESGKALGLLEETERERLPPSALS